MARVLAAVLGKETAVNSIAELMLDGDEHYDDIVWGLNRCKEHGHVAPERLTSVVRVGRSTHRAFWKKEDWRNVSAILRRATTLAYRRKSLRKLHGKYGTSTVRTNEGVLRHLEKLKVHCTLPELRRVLRDSHLRLLLCMKDIPHTCRVWARRLCDESHDSES